MKPPAHSSGRARESGSAVLAALAILVVTLVIVSSALSEARNRFRTSHQSSRWTQASHAAEAGAELALLSAQKSAWVADGWPSAPAAPGGAAVTKAFTLSTGVPNTGPISASVAVDQIALNGVNWLRIRSTGKADLSGGAVSGVDAQDVLLRKLSLRRDRSDGSSLANPQATRTVEILAEPITKSPFKWAFLLDQKVTMTGSASVDSFDSSDPAKSTGSLYDVAKRQSNGDITINGTSGTSNLGGNSVRGDLKYGGTAPTGTGGVTGTITGPSTETISPVLAPTWTTYNALPTVISGTTTLTGGTQASPARYKVSSLTVPGGNTLTMAPHAVGAESYIEVWVTGNFKTSGTGTILSKVGVHVTYHVAGDVDVSGSGFNNQSNLAANSVTNVISPAAGVTQKVNISGSGTFIGAVNAPGANVDISGSGSFSGAFIGKTLTISGSGGTHYDEALGRAGGGAAVQYHFASFVEAVR